MKRKIVLAGLVFLMILMMPTSVKADDPQDPSVQITVNITDGQTYSGILYLMVTTYHPDGIYGISLALDGYFLHSELVSVMYYDWDTTTCVDGSHVLRITARSNWPDDIQYTNWVEYTMYIDNVVETTTTTTDITTTSSPTEPDTGEPLGLSFDPILIGIVGGIGLISAVLVKRSMGGAKKVASDAKVLIICPYCGSKTEQGITKCQKCGADL